VVVIPEKETAHVYQANKKTGVIYVYENYPYWVPEIGQSRSRRKCIGILDKETGEIVPTRGRKPKQDKSALGSAEASVVSNRYFYGATYLLDAIGKKHGITSDLKTCFPDTFKQILSIAYYLILEDSSPLYRFEKWASLHKHPYGSDISSQRSSELFASISDDAKERFFMLQGKRRIEKEFWVYDTTTISSYSKVLRQVQYGYNKECDPLPQLKLALVYGEQSGLPFYYRKLAGNIPDTKTVKRLLNDLAALGFNKVKLVMDRGFYSEYNINELYREHLKFLVAVKTSLSLVRKEIDADYDDMRMFANYDQDRELYARTAAAEWNYTQARPYKGDVIKEKRRIYIHLYFSIDKAAEDERNFVNHLAALRKELLDGKRVEEHEKQYTKYFDLKTTSKRGAQVVVKEDAIKEAKRYYGYFAMISNETMDAMTALELYRAKDIIEKAFGNLKERLDMRRALVSSEKSLDGKLFVEFIALIFLSYIHKQMRSKKMYKDYTMQMILDKLDVIECFERPGQKLHVGEILDKQNQIYLDLGIAPPSSLQ
jgi:transposase